MPTGHEITYAYSSNDTTVQSWLPSSYDNQTTQLLPVPAYIHTGIPYQPPFKFESGAKLLEDKSRKPRPKGISNQEGFKCDHAGCRYRGTFNRKYELQRHMKKHTHGCTKKCPVRSCERTFHRKDKLKLHLMADHASEEDAVCSEPECESFVLPLALLRVHAWKHTRYGRHQDFGIESLASGWPVCPISKCTVDFSVKGSTMSQHLLDKHSLDERKAHQQAIGQAGHCHVTGNTICPFCEAKYASHDSLQEHLKEHLLTDVAHYESYHRSLKEASVKLHNWKQYWDRWFSWSLNSTHHCPACAARVFYSDKPPVDHHLSLLKDNDEIRPHRIALLALLLGFHRHPVFDELKPIVKKS